jgi:glycosyltransferase involved in cell wall biosynthesis
LAFGGVIIAADRISPILPHGKFFSRGGDKFFLKTIRLRASAGSLSFEEKVALHKQLEQLREAHTTALIISEDDAESLLDLAAQAGLYALCEIKLPPEELLSHRTPRAALLKLRERVATLRGCPALIGYLLDCPIDPDTVRSHGLDMLRARLSRIIAAIREDGAPKLVGLKHRAGTIGLALHNEDFVYAIIPPLAPQELRSSIIRLHNLAEARPVVLEFASVLADQDDVIAYAFGLGAAGVVAQAPRRDQSSSKLLMDGFLSFKPLDASELMPFLALNGSCPPKPAWTPKVSVIVCAYNAERTMRQCLESLRKLDYPNFEVIIVDDGSRDATAQIAVEFPEFRLIRQPNKGLSVARNVGLHAALGELIAYTDSDCVVDPHWLAFMVRAMAEGKLDGCGGPNYAPHEDGWVEGCVAASPGAPCHVLISDDRAEHLAGCNMLFRKSALEDIGGFDPQFTAAGDDVDVCWRLMDAGHVLGYCPSAFVWHFRRNTVKAYYGQQRGYGKAEAMLYFKYPERFNALGQIKWHGTIPGIARTIPGGGRLRVRWRRSADAVQHVEETPLSVLKVAPLTAEWNLAAAALLVLSLLFGVTIAPALAAVAAGPLWAAYYALKAPLEKCHRGPASRWLIGWLAYSGSIVRTIARYRWRLAARKNPLWDDDARQRPTIDWKQRSIRLSYWNDKYTTREAMLEHLRRFFASLGRPVTAATEWDDFDLLVEANPWARVQFRTADEDLSGLELRTNVAARTRLSTGARAGLGACLIATASAALLGSPLATAVFGIIGVVALIGAIGGLVEGANLAYHAVEQCAGELNFVPLGKPVKSPGTSPVPAAVSSEGQAEAAQVAGR